MKVLILINKVGLGDCIIHINYIHEISKKYGKPVSILAKENTRAKDLFLDDPHIDEVIILDRLNDNSGNHDGLSGFFKLARDIKEKKFDKVFIFNSSIRYFLICKFAGIKKIAQYPLFKIDKLAPYTPLNILLSQFIEIKYNINFKNESSDSHK